MPGKTIYNQGCKSENTLFHIVKTLQQQETTYHITLSTVQLLGRKNKSTHYLNAEDLRR